MRYLLAVLFLAFASLAAAHTPLVSSAPAANATLPGPVKQLLLVFGGDVRLTAVVLTDAQGAAKKTAKVPEAVAKQFTLAVEEDLRPGAYTVTWRAVGADTHVVSGEIHFAIAAAQPL